MKIKALIPLWNAAIVSSVVLWTLCAPAIEPRIGRNLLDEKTLLMEIREPEPVILTMKSSLINSPISIKKYMLFYHVKTDTVWHKLYDSIPVSNTQEIVLQRENIPIKDAKDSIFYFALQFETMDNILSDLISSSDSLTTSNGGWFLFWKPKQ